jgi:hypothetical protein
MGRPMKRQPNVKRERPAAAVEKRRLKTIKRRAGKRAKMH